MIVVLNGISSILGSDSNQSDENDGREMEDEDDDENEEEPEEDRSELDVDEDTRQFIEMYVKMNCLIALKLYGYGCQLNFLGTIMSMVDVIYPRAYQS